MSEPEYMLTQGEYGFAWGPLSVTRVTTLRGTAVIDIDTDAGKRLTVYVSPTGRSVRVFSQGQEWLPVRAASTGDSQEGSDE
jgi:hypothetical protein